ASRRVPPPALSICRRLARGRGTERSLGYLRAADAAALRCSPRVMQTDRTTRDVRDTLADRQGKWRSVRRGAGRRVGFAAYSARSPEQSVGRGGRSLPVVVEALAALAAEEAAEDHPAQETGGCEARFLVLLVQERGHVEHDVEADEV